MKPLYCAGLALVVALVARAETDLVGKTEAELIAVKGKPTSRVTAGPRAIYGWPDAVVTLNGGKVVSVSTRDIHKEQETNARGVVLAAVEKEKAQSVTQQRQDQYAAAQAKARQDAINYQAYQKKQEQIGAEQRRREADMALRSAQIGAARQESLRLKREVRQDYLKGQNTLNKRLELSAKERELKEMEKNRYSR